MQQCSPSSPGLQGHRNYDDGSSYRSEREELQNSTPGHFSLLPCVTSPWCVGIANNFQQSFIAGLIGSRGDTDVAYCYSWSMQRVCVEQKQHIWCMSVHVSMQ